LPGQKITPIFSHKCSTNPSYVLRFIGHEFYPPAEIPGHAELVFGDALKEIRSIKKITKAVYDRHFAAVGITPPVHGEPVRGHVLPDTSSSDSEQEQPTHTVHCSTEHDGSTSPELTSTVHCSAAPDASSGTETADEGEQVVETKEKKKMSSPGINTSLVLQMSAGLINRRDFGDPLNRFGLSILKVSVNFSNLLLLKNF
jgi:hypothetical protein